MAKTLAQTLKALPKARQRQIAARAQALRRAVLDHAEGPPRGGRYWCPHCARLLRRESDKAWVKSYCDRMERVVHLQRVPTVDAVARRLLTRRRRLLTRLAKG